MLTDDRVNFAGPGVHETEPLSLQHNPTAVECSEPVRLASERLPFFSDYCKFIEIYLKNAPTKITIQLKRYLEWWQVVAVYIQSDIMVEHQTNNSAVKSPDSFHVFGKRTLLNHCNCLEKYKFSVKLTEHMSHYRDIWWIGQIHLFFTKLIKCVA